MMVSLALPSFSSTTYTSTIHSVIFVWASCSKKRSFRLWSPLSSWSAVPILENLLGYILYSVLSSNHHKWSRHWNGLFSCQSKPRWLTTVTTMTTLTRATRAGFVFQSPHHTNGLSLAHSNSIYALLHLHISLFFVIHLQRNLYSLKIFVERVCICICTLTTRFSNFILPPPPLLSLNVFLEGMICISPPPAPPHGIKWG